MIEKYFLRSWDGRIIEINDFVRPKSPLSYKPSFTVPDNLIDLYDVDDVVRGLFRNHPDELDTLNRLRVCKATFEE